MLQNSHLIFWFIKVSAEYLGNVRRKFPAVSSVPVSATIKVVASGNTCKPVVKRFVGVSARMGLNRNKKMDCKHIKNAHKIIFSRPGQNMAIFHRAILALVNGNKRKYMKVTVKEELNDQLMKRLTPEKWHKMLSDYRLCWILKVWISTLFWDTNTELYSLWACCGST